jgi:serine/threonine-protein kinase
VRQLSPLLDELLEASAQTRAQRLAQIRRDDEALADHLETLLRQRTAIERDAFLEGDTGFTLAHEPSLAGQTIGAYTLREPLGHGGMGSVWRAESSDGRYQASVAVKFLNLALLGRGGVERFAREGNSWRACRIRASRACSTPV